MMSHHIHSFLSATLVLCMICVGSACTDREATPAIEPAPTVLIEALGHAVEAHGGLDRWRSFGTLEYDIRKGEMTEHLIIDLHSRQLQLTGEGYIIGFDGEEVWVMPQLQAFEGTPRFYSSLDFYFFGLPFLFADPGTVHESLGIRTVGNVDYDVVKVSYEQGVGDSPNDYYLPHFRVDDGQLELLLYTVTYRSQEPNERFSARTYTWQEVQGLKVPDRMSSYRWDAENSQLGDHRNDATFENVSFSVDRPDPSLFQMPEGAEIDPMPSKADTESKN